MVGYDKSVEAFQRVDDVNAVIDPMVMESSKVRKKVVTMLLNLVKSGRDKTMGDVGGVDGVEATMRALASSNSRVSAREKSKAEALLRVMKSRWGNQS